MTGAARPGPGPAGTASVEEHISRLVGSLTVADKAHVTAGRSLWETAELPGIGLRSMLLSDGPLGVRGPVLDERSTSICAPSATSLAATWDTDLAERVGRLIADEAVRLGVHVVLGPVVNLHRTPLGGRVFENFSEDPLLAGYLARAWVAGVQQRGVAATAKHFVANDSEQDRLKADCRVDERTLRELYLVPFEILAQAGVWAVMAAYNSVNGIALTCHRELLRTVLKDEWGFDGVVMNDWYAWSDTVESAAAGLDLEMPGPGRAYGPQLAAAAAHGGIGPAVLDDMVARILRLAARAGCLSGVGSVGNARSAAEDAEDAERVLLDAAVGGITLLRNDGILPLADPVRRIAVVGPAATQPSYMGAGSAEVHMVPALTPAEAISREFCGLAEVIVEPGCTSRVLPVPLEQLGMRAEISVEYLARDQDGTRVVARERRATSSFTWVDGLAPGITMVRVVADLWPTRTGSYQIAASGTGAIAVTVDEGTPAHVDAVDALNYAALVCLPPARATQVQLRAGRPARCIFEMAAAPSPMAIMRIGCVPPEDPGGIERAVAAAATADVAIMVVGTTEQDEHESEDRATMTLPGRQDELVRKVLAANPATIVVLNAPGAVDLSCARSAPALLHAGFGGQEMGAAIAAVLSGAREPGGRLPFTIARSAAGYPVLSVVPGDNHVIRYDEGLFIGYRHFDRRSIEPEFCFGHGLGYTTFGFENLRLSADRVQPGDNVTIEVGVRNTGPRAGKAVVQVYVAPPDTDGSRPPRELRAFTALTLEAGEYRVVSVVLTPRSFAHWDEAAHCWAITPGAYRVEAGRSSRDICLRSAVTVEPEASA
jgi:beta-glucosidase